LWGRSGRGGGRRGVGVGGGGGEEGMSREGGAVRFGDVLSSHHGCKRACTASSIRYLFHLSFCCRSRSQCNNLNPIPIRLTGFAESYPTPC